MPPESPDPARGLARQMLVIGAALVAGAPMVYVLWDTINHLLAGDLAAIHPLISGGALIGFVVVAWILARTVTRLDA